MKYILSVKAYSWSALAVPPHSAPHHLGLEGARPRVPPPHATPLMRVIRVFYFGTCIAILLMGKFY